MAFVIPSIFTAVDQYSGKVNAMQKATMGFNASLILSLYEVEPITYSFKIDTI